MRTARLKNLLNEVWMDPKDYFYTLHALFEIPIQLVQWSSTQVKKTCEQQSLNSIKCIALCSGEWFIRKTAEMIALAKYMEAGWIT